MDKFEVIGYSTAGVCVVATLAVFFLWIMPANSAISADLSAIKSEAGKLKLLLKDNESALGGDTPADVSDIMKRSQQALATKEVIAAAKQVRADISARTRDLIARVVKSHEVEKPDLPVDRVRPGKEMHQQLQTLFAEKKVRFAGTKEYNLPPADATNINEYEFNSLVLFQKVATALLNTGTNVKITKPTVDVGSHDLNILPESITESVSSIQSFLYYDKDKWANRLKAYRDETVKAARLAANPGEPDATRALPYERVGFRIVFQTNPANVGAALNSLEQVDGSLVTLKRLEIIRAGLPIYNYAEWLKEQPPIPMPFREGNVQITAEVEMLSFTKGASEEMSKKLAAAE